MGVGWWRESGLISGEEGHTTQRMKWISITMCRWPHAHRTGGWAWDGELKVQFANDPEKPERHIIIVEPDQGVSGGRMSGRPPVESSHCAYARQWEALKAKYELTISGSERRTLDDMLATCANTFPTPTTPSRFLPRSAQCHIIPDRRGVRKLRRGRGCG